MSAGFKITVEGDYFARSEALKGEKIIRKYRIEGLRVPSMNRVLSTLRDKLLTPALKRKYPDYVRFRTYHVVEVEALDNDARRELGKLDTRYMSRRQLEQYVMENGLQVPVDLYPNLFKLREAVQMARTDPKAYETRLEKDRPSLEQDIELARMNPGLFDTPNEGRTGVGASVAANHAATGQPSPKKALPRKQSEAQAADRLNGLKTDMIRDNEMGETREPESDAQASLEDI